MSQKEQLATQFQIYCTHSFEEKVWNNFFIISLKAVLFHKFNNVRKDVEKILFNNVPVRRIKINSTTEKPVSEL